MSVLTNSNTIQTTLKVSQATSSSKIDTSDDDWAKFADEYDLYGISVNDNCWRKWRAMIKVKIEPAKNLDKSINSYTGSNKFCKYWMDDVFEWLSRNLKTEVNTIPLCAGRLESGAVKIPRIEPQADYRIFIDKNGEFDSNLFQSAKIKSDKIHIFCTFILCK